MDDSDLAILRAMGARRCGPVGCPREDVTPAAIARKVQMDPSTVQARIRKMQEQGFLSGFELFPNLRLFDMAECVYFFDKIDPAAKAHAMERLALVDGLIEAHDFWRDTLCVVMAYRSPSDRARKANLLREFIGREGRHIFERQRPTLKRALDRTDWRILRALRHDALRPHADVAAELGISTKTARRRIDQLAEAHAYFLLPTLDPRKGDGFVTAGFLIWLAEHDQARHAARVREVMSGRRFFDEQAITGNLYLVGGFHTPAEVGRAESLIAGTEGVERVEAYMIQGAHTYAGWIDEAIDARIENTPQA